MICKNCGKYISDDSRFCSNCGSQVASEVNENGGYTNNQQTYQSQQTYQANQYQQPNQNQRPIESKSVIGAALAFFLGLIGLLIGLLLYPVGTYERETFLRGWIKCFVICIIIEVGILICVGLFCAIFL